MKRTILLLSFLLCLSILSAQQLYFNHLSVNNGLSQGVNNCIYRDSRGFVWISSFDGLNRFDGISCSRFRASNDNGLKGTLFLNILEDQQSNLWIGSNEGLNMYDRLNDRFVNYRMPGRLHAEQFISPFYIDRQRRVWLQSNATILVFDPAKSSFTVVDSHFPTGSLMIKALPVKPFEDMKSLLVISNKSPVLHEGTLMSTRFIWKSTNLEFNAGKINALTTHGGAQVWLGTDQGLFSYNRDSKLFQPIQHNGQSLNMVSSLHLDSTRKLWVGTFRDGLYESNGSRILNQYRNSSFDGRTVSGNQVQYITTDKNGNLWVAVWGKGVDYTSPGAFRFQHHITREDAVRTGTDNFIRSIIEVGNETWCGTQSGGIIILDSSNSITTTVHNGIPSTIEHLAIDNDQFVWVATLDGLFVVNPYTRQATKAPSNVSAGSTRANQYNYIINTSKGSMLASTNAGLFFIRRLADGWLFSEAKGVNQDDVYLTTFIDRRGVIYISRAFKGFAQYSLQGDSLVKTGEFAVQSTIKCFVETNDSTLWIGSTTGLIDFNTRTNRPRRTLTTAEGLTNHYIYGIVPSGNDLWLSSNAGINRYNLNTGVIQSYSEGDGLQSNEFNTYAFLKKSNGQVLFGGINGLNAFNPDQHSTPAAAPNLVLSRMFVNDSLYISSLNPTEHKSLSVDYKHNTLGFEFTVISFSNPAGSTVEYMLDGFDHAPVRVANKTQIRYANLPAGNYVLKVRGFNSDGTPASNSYRIRLSVSAPWWQTWWFRTFVFLALAALVITIVRNYVRRKEERHRNELEKRTAIENERNRISRDMHDDLGSGLTKIAILSEVVKKQLAEPEKAEIQLEKIASSSRELVDSLQDIIWVLNPKNDSLESLSAYIREYALKFFDESDITVQFKYPERFQNQYLSEEQRRNIFLTLKEVFNNIIRHANAKHVFVTIAENKGNFRIRVEDDGKGFVADEVRKFANGLRNMKSRIESSGGTLHIDSSPGMGTRTDVTFRL